MKRISQRDSTANSNGIVPQHVSYL